MNREIAKAAVKAAAEGQKEKAAYLLEHVNDPEVICFLPKGEAWESSNGKYLINGSLILNYPWQGSTGRKLLKLILPKLFNTFTLW